MITFIPRSTIRTHRLVYIDILGIVAYTFCIDSDILIIAIIPDVNNSTFGIWKYNPIFIGTIIK
jgi:hypothetical protein